jgi:nitroreductase
MDALEAIRTRRSIRRYEDRAVPEDLVEEVLRAAMMAPSAVNKQPWHFVVIDDRELLLEIPKINPNAAMAAGAPLAILVCGDLELEHPSGYWVVDCAAAVENLLLAAHALGLGAVWTGVYPRQQRMDGLRRLLGIPEHVMPHTLVVLGYPAEQPPSKDRYRPERVHRNGFG